MILGYQEGAGKINPQLKHPPTFRVIIGKLIKFELVGLRPNIYWNYGGPACHMLGTDDSPISTFTFASNLHYCLGHCVLKILEQR